MAGTESCDTGPMAFASLSYSSIYSLIARQGLRMIFAVVRLVLWRGKA